MTKVRQFTEHKFFVVDTSFTEVKYFNGRKWHILREMKHFVHPNHHDGDFSTHITVTFYETERYRSEMLRHSTFQWGPAYQ